MKIKRFKTVNDISYGLDEFDVESKILLVTGLSGSGKSFLTNELQKKYNAHTFQVEWLKHHTHISEECEYILDTFLKKYPQIKNCVKNKWDNTRREDNNPLFKEYINLFFKHFLEVKDPNKLYIVEGIQLFSLIDFDLIKDYPIIIKGTSAYNSFKNRFHRDYQKRKGSSFPTKIKFFIRVLNESRLYQGKHVRKLNKFIKLKEKHNG